MRLAEKEGKKNSSRIPFILDLGKKIPIKIAKKFKKLKNPFSALFFAKTGRDTPKNIEEIFSPECSSYSARARKFWIKYLKNSKNDRPKIREKNFSPEFRSYSARGRKFWKKIAKKFENLKNLFLALFLFETGWDRLRKREKKFSLEVRSYSARGRKFWIE